MGRRLHGQPAGGACRPKSTGTKRDAKRARGDALLVCGYEDEAKCARMRIKGALSSRNSTRSVAITTTQAETVVPRRYTVNRITLDNRGRRRPHGLREDPAVAGARHRAAAGGGRAHCHCSSPTPPIRASPKDGAVEYTFADPYNCRCEYVGGPSGSSVTSGASLPMLSRLAMRGTRGGPSSPPRPMFSDRCWDARTSRAAGHPPRARGRR